MDRVETDQQMPSRNGSHSALSEASTPPDGGYGFVCLGCVFAINGFTWGVVAAYGVFLSYYLEHDYFPGAQPRDFAFVGGLNFGVAMIAAPLVTVAVRVLGTKPPMYAGALILLVGFTSASFSTQIWHLYLSQGAAIGLGVGCVYIPSIPILSQWFSRRRSLANGISTAGSGIGGLLFSLATGTMIDNLGLLWALRTIGCISCGVNLLSTYFIKDRNAVIRPRQRPFDCDLVRQPRVLWLLAWAVVSMLGYITLLYSLSDFSRSIHLDRSQATNITAFLNLGTAIGRPLIGLASDHLGRFQVASGLTLSCGLCCFALWIPAKSYAVTIVFALISGAILGVFWVVSTPALCPQHPNFPNDAVQTVAPLCAEIVGLKQLPSLLALSWLSIVLPTTCKCPLKPPSPPGKYRSDKATVSEVIALHLRRPGQSREYLYTQVFCGSCYVVASGCLWRCKRVQDKLDAAGDGGPPPR